MSSRPTRPPRIPRPSRTPGTALGLLGAILGTSVLGGVLLAGLALPTAAAIGTVSHATGEMLSELPSEVELPPPSQQSVIRFADGSTMAHFYAENRVVVPLDRINQNMRNAVVAIEDKRFYEHVGVDPQGIARAFVNNIAGGPLEGASTLTQQYVRNALVEAGRQSGDAAQIDAATDVTAGRKVREIGLAVALERQVSKEEILAGYLNIAQFGPSQYGVEAASQHYFSIPASDLDVAQAALLAGITQSPNRWDPVGYPEDAQVRRDTVLGEMLSQGFIDQAAYDAAVATPISAMLVVQDTPNGCDAAGISGYFCEYVVKDLLNNEGWGTSRDERVQMLYRGGLVIDTTLDPRLQQAAYDAATRVVPVDDPSGIDASVVSVEPGTGHIVAMAQNTNFGVTTEADPEATTINVNAGRTHGGGLGFDVGSTFKVFALVEWVNSGRGLYDRVNQENRTFRAGSWKIPCAPELTDNYSPKNLYNMTGTTTVINATKMSTNVPFVSMANQLNLCTMIDDAAKLGVERGDGGQLEPRPSAVLGTNEVTPLSMASAFASMSARGNACRPVAITRVSDWGGAEYDTPGSQCQQVLPERVMDTVTFALQQVLAPGGTADDSAIGRPAAGKTGTANQATNAWFVGYTPQYSTAVWTGHRTGYKPMLRVRVNGTYHSTVFGSSVAAPIWERYMREAHQGLPVERFQAPPRQQREAPAPRPSRSTGGRG